MQVLDVRDTKQVESVSFIEADLGVFNRRLLVLSGIALTDWKYNSDQTFPGMTQVRLGVFASNLEQWSAFVGLASIGNDDSSFVFAVDTATVLLDPTTGEMLLNVNTALMGSWSYLGRFSYQVVATVVQVTAHIGGTITWPKSLFTPQSLDPALVVDAFVIRANRYENIPPSANSFGFEKLTPLAPGQIYRVQAHGANFVADYRIDNPQLAIDLKVTVDAGNSLRQAGNVVVGQVAGPTVFKLTGSAPSIEGINFVANVLRLG
jgi:hypothetical protein